MGRIGAAVVIDHIVGIPVVGCQENRITIVQCGFHHPFYAFVHRFGGLDDCFPDACMADHIRIGIVETNKVSGLILDLRNDGIGQFHRAHFRLQIVGGHFGGWDHQPAFPFKWRFPAAAEEKADVRIFFCFCDADLSEPICGNYLTQRILQVVVLKNDVYALETGIILGHRRIVQPELFHFLVRDIGLCQHFRYLAAAVCPEIETNGIIPVLNGSQRQLIRTDDDGWFYKFVGNTCGIGCFYGGQGIGGFWACRPGPLHHRPA